MVLHLISLIACCQRFLRRLSSPQVSRRREWSLLAQWIGCECFIHSPEFTRLRSQEVQSRQVFDIHVCFFSDGFTSVHLVIFHCADWQLFRAILAQGPLLEPFFARSGKAGFLGFSSFFLHSRETAQYAPQRMEFDWLVRGDPWPSSSFSAVASRLEGEGQRQRKAAFTRRFSTSEESAVEGWPVSKLHCRL